MKVKKVTVIAIDFDGTLCENEYPNIGFPKWSIINEAKRRQKNGDKLILWTCREGELLNRAVAWCKDKGLVFDAVNESLESWREEYDNDPRKIGASEYWDDRAKSLEEIEREIKEI